MAIIPATPSFTTSTVASLTSLSALSTLSALGAQYELAWKVYKASTQTASSGATTSMTWTSAAWIPDGNWTSSSSVITVETQGYYSVNMYLNSTPAGTTLVQVWFTITSAGVTTSFGTTSGTWAGNSGTVLSAECGIPQLCLVGDTISTWINPSSANVALNGVGSGQAYNPGTSSDYANILDGGCWFTGRLLSIGGTP
jgi:hypothetical protein